MTTLTVPPIARLHGTRPAARPPWALLLVALVVCLLAIVPLTYLAIRAVEGGSGAFEALWRPRTLELIASTLALGVCVAIGAIGIGLPLAWLTVRTDLPGRHFWAVAAVAPLAVPSYLLAFSFVGAFSARGWLASWLGRGSLEILPDPYGLPGATLILTLATTPYVVIATRAALSRLDPALDEAARSLGSGPWAAARAAVLPVILPALGAGALLAALYSISDFGAVSILRYDTLATAVYSQYRLSFDRSAAAALAILLLALGLVLVFTQEQIRRRAASRAPHGRRSVASLVSLGRWRWPGLALCSVVAGLSLGIPILTVAAWFANGLGRALARTDTLDALRDSLVLAGSSAGLALVVAVPLAWLIVRYPSRASGLSERLLYAVYAIPGISLALGLVFFTLNVLPTLYQTLFVLVIALAMRFLVQSVGALHGPILQISPRTLEAARSLGDGHLTVARTISLPLLRPGLVAGLALVFLSALKELPLTLLLAPAGFKTLATTLWDATREAVYSQAALPALLLLVVSFVSVGLLLRRGESTA